MTCSISTLYIYIYIYIYTTLKQFSAGTGQPEPQPLTTDRAEGVQKAADLSLTGPELRNTGSSGRVGVCGMGGRRASETVEESGPVEYSDGEEGEEEGGGLRDADMDELAYEGDPLLYSDYEEDGRYSTASITISWYILSVILPIIL